MFCCNSKIDCCLVRSSKIIVVIRIVSMQNYYPANPKKSQNIPSAIKILNKMIPPHLYIGS